MSVRMGTNMLDTWLPPAPFSSSRRTFTGASKVVSVELDPHEKIWIDLDKSNDRWFAETSPVPAWRWAERALSQTARYLQWFSRLGG